MHSALYGNAECRVETRLRAPVARLTRYDLKVMSPTAANATANSSPSTLASRKNGGRPEVSGRRPLRSLLECDPLLDLLARDAEILRDPLDGVAGFHPASDDFGSYPGSRDDRVAEGHSGIDGDKPVDVGDDDRKEADRAGCVFRMCCIEKACSRRRV